LLLLLLLLLLLEVDDDGMIGLDWIVLQSGHCDGWISSGDAMDSLRSVDNDL
jgi:hypothetical protein